MNDDRNVLDEFKGMPHEDIVDQLNQRGIELEVAVENLERDFNMGTIIRNANAFGVRTVHVIGRRQWNKRGAMMTDKYVTVIYYESVPSFTAEMKADKRTILAIDNVNDSTKLHDTELPSRSVMVFGSEKSGLSRELLEGADRIIAIEQLGSTRSVNVGVASGIAIYRWLSCNYL